MGNAAAWRTTSIDPRAAHAFVLGGTFGFAGSIGAILRDGRWRSALQRLGCAHIARPNARESGHLMPHE